MKKIFIVCLLLFALAGCNTIEDGGEIEGEEGILAFREEHFDVCVDSCASDKASYDVYKVVWGDKINELTFQTNTGGSEIGLLDNEEVIAKEDILRENPLYNSNHIFQGVYFGFLEIISDMYPFVNCCVSGGDCEFPQPLSQYENLSSLHFEFNEFEGYYKFTISEDDNIVRLQESKFIITEDNLSFKSYTYDLSNGFYMYQYFEEGIYREYRYASDTDYSFTYININTTDYIMYNIRGESEGINIYDSNTQILYTSNMTDSFTVSLYDNMNFVTSLKLNDEVYTHKIGLFYLNGWDQMKYKPVIDSYYSKAFYEGEEVFTGYDILMHNFGLYYYKIYVVTEMNESEFNNYIFPEEYIGTMSQEELYDELEYFRNLEEPLSIMSITQEDIQNTFKNILDMLEGMK